MRGAAAVLMALAAVLMALMTFVVTFLALAVGELVAAAAFVTAAGLAAASVVAAVWIDRPGRRPSGRGKLSGAAAVLMAFGVLIMASMALGVAYIASGWGQPVAAAAFVTVAAVASSSVVAAVWIDRPSRKTGGE